LRKGGAWNTPELLNNGDTQKQLLAISRYLLFKSKTKWTARQIERAKVLFELYPTIENTQQFSTIIALYL
jgi:hypothetical protein